jgi:hypothetical protein
MNLRKAPNAIALIKMKNKKPKKLTLPCVEIKLGITNRAKWTTIPVNKSEILTEYMKTQTLRYFQKDIFHISFVNIKSLCRP